MFPNFENPTNSRNAIEAFEGGMYTELKFLLIASLAFPKNSADTFGYKMVKILNAKTKRAVTTDTNTFMSKPYFVKFRE